MKSSSLRDLGRVYAEIRERAEDEGRIADARVSVEALSSGELTSLARSSARFSSLSAASAGERLLLPRIACVTDLEIRGAIARIAEVKESAVEGARIAADRERRMRALLVELAEMIGAVHRRPSRVV